ncbi:hypothetical protein B0H16DRAFT_1482686 [Mycena metata]|uniref:Uncharacterized protein n=1 Tax=Mycena metata TaxID=1033252 RepID=A0AAD7GSG3_9AGAR|nr:hypothetical protein B0H16DRAFT_1482686 [Mycena metata]
MFLYLSPYRKRAALRCRPLPEQEAAAERERAYQAKYRAKNRNGVRLWEAQRRVDVYIAQFTEEGYSPYENAKRVRRRPARANQRAKTDHFDQRRCPPVVQNALREAGPRSSQAARHMDRCPMGNLEKTVVSDLVGVCRRLCIELLGTKDDLAAEKSALLTGRVLAVISRGMDLTHRAISPKALYTWASMRRYSTPLQSSQPSYKNYPVIWICRKRGIRSARPGHRPIQGFAWFPSPTLVLSEGLHINLHQFAVHIPTYPPGDFLYSILNGEMVYTAAIEVVL